MLYLIGTNIGSGAVTPVMVQVLEVRIGGERQVLFIKEITLRYKKTELVIEPRFGNSFSSEFMSTDRSESV